MTQPKRHLPNEKVLITRRTHERRFLLRPDEHVYQLIEYALALYAGQYNIDLHAVVVMSNHIHLVITDNEGTRSEFMRAAFALIARGRNYQLGRHDSFWSCQPVGDCVLLDEETLMNKCIYTWNNPVYAGMVQTPESWPGFLVGLSDWGKRKVVKRPELFFPRTGLPDAVIYIPKAPQHPTCTPGELMQCYANALNQTRTSPPASSKQQQLSHRNITQRFQRTSVNCVPATPDVFNKLNPQFAGTKALRETYYAELILFKRDHAAARMHLRRGEFDDLFIPPGTISLRRQMPTLCQDDVASSKAA